MIVVLSYDVWGGYLIYSNRELKYSIVKGVLKRKEIKIRIYVVVLFLSYC